eukprot:SAG11_NODE_11_length_27870_cov_16.327428_6_plen_151_part_00
MSSFSEMKRSQQKKKLREAAQIAALKEALIAAAGEADFAIYHDEHVKAVIEEFGVMIAQGHQISDIDADGALQVAVASRLGYQRFDEDYYRVAYCERIGAHTVPRDTRTATERARTAAIRSWQSASPVPENEIRRKQNQLAIAEGQNAIP